jgi:hypothetical protein
MVVKQQQVDIKSKRGLTRADRKMTLTHDIKSVFELEASNIVILTLAKESVLDIHNVLNLLYDNIAGWQDTFCVYESKATGDKMNRRAE